MRYSTFAPPASLSHLVRFFWELECDSVSSPYVHRVMADCCTELLFHYKGLFHEIDEKDGMTLSFRSGIHAQSDHYRRFIIHEGFGIFGVYLYPYAIKMLLNIPSDELTNEMPDLHSVLGPEGQELEERIILATNTSERIHIFSDFMLHRLSKLPHHHEHPAVSAIRYAVHAKNLPKVRDLATHFNLSERQFERKFSEHAGMSPKRFMRIVRFANACNFYRDKHEKTLTRIAYECGYFDQSHFIREFRTFSGYEPRQYFTGHAEGTEWRD